VHAYRNILKDIHDLLPEYETEQMRTYIEHGTVEDSNPCRYSFFSPVLYLQLKLDDRDTTISVARNDEIGWRVPRQLETALVRAIYRNAEKTATSVNTEDCLESLCYAYDNFEDHEDMLRREQKVNKCIVVKFKEA
jgi:hypothetical protein